MPGFLKESFRHIPRPEARAAMISLGVGVAMLVVKFLAYARTGSAAILSDALEGIVNVLAAAFAAYSIATAHRPADEEHPYGHGKIEFLSAGFEGGMIVLAAMLMVGQAIASIIHIHRHGQQLEAIAYGMVLMGVASAVHTALGLYLIGIGKRQQSLTLEADGWHLLTDAATSVVALMSLLIVHFTGWAYADPLGALLIALYITSTGWRLVRRAAAGLMDEQDLEDERLLKGILDAHVQGKEPRICSYHKLRHRHSGRYHWVDFHLMVPAWWDIRRGHEIASAIEYEIEQAIGVGNATAHVEPCADASCGSCHHAHSKEAISPKPE
jgi:cation diffusion facilitator family transporter